MVQYVHTTIPTMLNYVAIMYYVPCVGMHPVSLDGDGSVLRRTRSRNFLQLANSCTSLYSSASSLVCVIPSIVR